MVGLGLPAVLMAQAELPDSEYVALGRRLTHWFYDGQADSIFAHLSDESRERVGSASEILRRSDSFSAQAGVEQQLVVEKITRRRGQPQYWRESRYSNLAAEAIVIRWVFDAEGRVTGVGMGPLSSTPAPD